MSLNSTMTSASNGYPEWVTSNPTRAEVCVALTGNPEVHGDACAGSANINAGNMFNSPDGIGFDNKGMPWIQTDGNYSNEKDFAGRGNNRMLVGDPVTGEIRRFPAGPKECETTGIAWPADRNPRSLASSIRARTATTASLTAAFAGPALPRYAPH